MKLSQAQIEILKGVKEAYDNRPRPLYYPERCLNFICWNVLTYVGGKDLIHRLDKNLYELREEVGGDADAIIQAILVALGGESTIESYLANIFEKKNLFVTTRDSQADAAGDYAELARSTWLERMIETRVIA